MSSVRTTPSLRGEHSGTNLKKFKLPRADSNVSIFSLSDGKSDGVSEIGQVSPSSNRKKIPFKGINREAAVQRVFAGELLTMFGEDGGELWWKAKCRHLMSKLRKRKIYYFVVIEAREGRYELHWDIDADKAARRDCKCCIPLSEIRDVAAIVLRDEETDGDTDLNNQKFRILYGQSQMRLWAPTRQAMKEWVVALLVLVRQSQGSAMRSITDVDGSLKGYIQSIFDDLDPLDGKVQSSHLGDRLKEFDIHVADDYLNDIMFEFGKAGGDCLDIKEFTELFSMLTVKETLLSWFQKYAEIVRPDDDEIDADGDQTNRHRAMSADRFQLFMEIEQGENRFFGSHVGLEGPDGLFERLKAPFTEKVSGRRFLTLAGFSRLMCGAENALFDPARRGSVCQDMTRPLSHYWIASSHNTYLEGHQLVGSSSVEQYIDVLLRGCRCVEIDCWDGDDGEPIVTHGWTATSRLQFRDVVGVCRDYGFVASLYPLILSLEVHCSEPQVNRMASIISQTFGDMLLTHVAGANVNLVELVSPEDAKRKVIVKAKVKTREHNRPSSRSISTDSHWTLRSCLRRLCCRGRRRDIEEDLPANQCSNSLGTTCVGDSGLSEVTYLFGKSIKHQDGALTDEKSYPCTCISLNDQTATSIFNRGDSGVAGLQKVCRRQLVRIYPHSSRVSSGNFDPFDMWLCGAQMVAMNYQSLDLPLICNEGLFHNENGGSGYVLKPLSVRGSNSAMQKASANSFVSFKAPRTSQKAEATLRTSGRFSTLQGSNFASDIADTIEAGLSCTLEITVLSGHSLPKLSMLNENKFSYFGEKSQNRTVISPLVRVSICGAYEDRRSAETQHVHDNGFNPRWHQHFSFKVVQPTVAMLAFEVLSVGINKRKMSREFIAAAALPLSGLREGVRWMQLLDWRHQPIEFCGLLVEVRAYGPWAEFHRRRRLQQAPVSPEIARAIQSGWSGLGSFCADTSIIDKSVASNPQCFLGSTANTVFDDARTNYIARILSSCTSNSSAEHSAGSRPRILSNCTNISNPSAEYSSPPSPSTGSRFTSLLSAGSRPRRLSSCTNNSDPSAEYSPPPSPSTGSRFTSFDSATGSRKISAVVSIQSLRQPSMARIDEGSMGVRYEPTPAPQSEGDDGQGSTGPISKCHDIWV